MNPICRFLLIGVCLSATTSSVSSQMLFLPRGENPDSLVILSSSSATGQTILFAGGKAGVYVSKDRGYSWTNVGLYGRTVHRLARLSEPAGMAELYASTEDSVYLSTDDGRNWARVLGPHHEITGLLCIHDRSGRATVFVSLMGDGVCRSADRGKRWSHVNTDLPDLQITALVSTTDAAGRTTLITGSKNGGVSISTDDGDHWWGSNFGLYERSIVTMVSCSSESCGGIVYAATEHNGVYRSEDNTATWISVKNGLSDFRILSMVRSPFPVDCQKNPNGPTIYVRTASGYFFTIDKGQHWISMKPSPTGTISSPDLPLRPTHTEEVQISGRVTDSATGEPLAGANVVAVGSAYGSATDLDGVFHLSGVQPGIYTLRVAYVGYETQLSKTLTVKEDVAAVANFEMVPMEIQGSCFPLTQERPLVKRFGLTLGVAASTWNWRAFGEKVSGIDHRAGFDIGAFVECFDLWPFSMIAEVRYVQKGMKQQIPITTTEFPDGTGENEDVNIRLDHISIGILPKYRLNTIWGELYALAGLQAHIPVHSVVGADGPEPMRSLLTRSNQMMVDEFRSPQVGASLGLGVLVEHWLPFAVGAEIRYSPNLEAAYTTSYSSIRNESFEFSLTISPPIERVIYVIL